MLNFGIITAYAKLSEDFFWIHFNMTMPEVITLSIPGYVLVCHLLGHYDEKIGFWQVEKNLIYRFSPFSDEMRKDIREIKESLVKGT